MFLQIWSTVCCCHIFLQGFINAFWTIRCMGDKEYKSYCFEWFKVYWWVGFFYFFEWFKVHWWVGFLIKIWLFCLYGGANLSKKVSHKYTSMENDYIFEKSSISNEKLSISIEKPCLSNQKFWNIAFLLLWMFLVIRMFVFWI